MKKPFLTLFLLLSLFVLSAQERHVDNQISSFMSQYTGSRPLKVTYQALEMDSVTAGWAAGLYFSHFQEKIEFQDGCELLFPKDEKIAQVTDKYVFTQQQNYNSSTRTLSKYLIRECDIQLESSKSFPFETEIMIGKDGSVLVTDCYMDYGKNIFVLDDQLEIRVQFSPFEQGFNELKVEENAESWILLIKIDVPQSPAETILFSLNKKSNEFTSLFNLPHPKTQGWYPFSLRKEGLLYFRLGRKLAFCDREGKLSWELDAKAYFPSIGDQYCAFLAEDSIHYYSIAEGQRQWVHSVKTLAEQNLAQAEKEKLSGCKLGVDKVYVHEKGLFLVLSWACDGLSADYAPRGIFIDHRGNILKDQSLGESFYGLNIFPKTDTITLLLDEEFHSYDLSE